MGIHYEVESELNPLYEKTGNIKDYYGIYHVVKFEGDSRIAVVKTFDYTNGTRSNLEAYAHARELQGTP